MPYNNNILLGRITKISGYEGAVTVKLEKIFSENIPEMESVFLEIEGRPVPFFISSLVYSGANILKLSFEGYSSDEKVNEFIGCRVFLTAGIPSDSPEEDIKLLTGYKVYFGENEFLGSVNEVILNHGQWLLNITSLQGKEILIPFHDHFIVSVNSAGKVIVMSLPEGLIDLN